MYFPFPTGLIFRQWEWSCDGCSISVWAVCKGTGCTGEKCSLAAVFQERDIHTLALPEWWPGCHQPYIPANCTGCKVWRVPLWQGALLCLILYFQGIICYIWCLYISSAQSQISSFILLWCLYAVSVKLANLPLVLLCIMTRKRICITNFGKWHTPLLGYILWKSSYIVYSYKWDNQTEQTFKSLDKHTAVINTIS